MDEEKQKTKNVRGYIEKLEKEKKELGMTVFYH